VQGASTYLSKVLQPGEHPEQVLLAHLPPSMQCTWPAMLTSAANLNLQIRAYLASRAAQLEGGAEVGCDWLHG